MQSNDADLDRVDAVRADSDAILVGAATLRNDNPRLLVRAPSRRRSTSGSPISVSVCDVNAMLCWPRAAATMSAHSTPEIQDWLAHKNRRRWHLHFPPTSSSWLNLIERWFKELTDKRLRRGAFTSVAELSAAITKWAQHWNLDPKPFIWKASADDIIAKVKRGRETLHQIKSQTQP